MSLLAAIGETREAGQGLELILADGTVHEHRGHLVAADAAVNPTTGTFTFEADFPNPDDLVISGQFGRVRAKVETKEGALLVPQRSITEMQGIFRVFVVSADGTVEMREVLPAERIDRLQIVESGIRAGDRVAFDGVLRLQDGMTVEPTLIELDEKGAPAGRPDPMSSPVGGA